MWAVLTNFEEGAQFQRPYDLGFVRPVTHGNRLRFTGRVRASERRVGAVDVPHKALGQLQRQLVQRQTDSSDPMFVTNLVMYHNVLI